MKNQRTILHLSPEALAAIASHAPSPNKRGAWASLAITEYVRLLEDNTNPTGTIERIDQRLNRLELTLNRIINESRLKQ
jgi:hypothetical protein